MVVRWKSGVAETMLLLSIPAATSSCDSNATDEQSAGGAGLTAGAGGGGTATGGSGGGGQTPVAGVGAGGTSAANPSRDAATLANAAVIIGSCLPDDGINRNSLYLWAAGNSPRFWHALASQAACVGGSGDACAAIDRCFGWTYAHSATACEPSCAGSVFSICEEGLRGSIDCARLGLGCDVRAVCSRETSAACDPETFERTCTSDGMPVFCDDDAVFRGPSCANFGLVCDAGYCVGTGSACSGESLDQQGGVYFDGMACDGDELVACVGGRETRRDCTAVAPGFRCQSVEGEAFCGLASECLPALDAGRYGIEERCEGNTVVFCNAGRLERIDCTTLGFTGCDVEDGYGCVPGPAF